MTKHISVLTFALALAMASPLTVQAQDSAALAKGTAAYEGGDYQAAADIWAPLAEDGEPEAQRNLAQLYRLGLGVDKNDERAFELYTAAAEQNSVDAQVNVAFLLLTGEGVEKDSKQAALWFAKAADQGDALAQFNLGLMYEKGVGVRQDRKLARELYRLSANQGQKRALARLDAIEGDLPPDGGEQARRERDEAEDTSNQKAEAAERARKRQEADVKRLQERAAAEEEEKRRSTMEKAEAEAKTGPILMIEKVEEPEDTEMAEKPGTDDADEKPRDTVASADGRTGDTTAIMAMEKAEAASGDAPTTTPPARRKPQVTAQVAPAPRQFTQPRMIQTVPLVQPAQPMTQRQQVMAAEAAYARGEFRQTLDLLVPLARGGMPHAQFMLGRMFNRGEGVNIDHFQTYSLWRSAASKGSERAATALANFAGRFASDELARAEAFYQSQIR